MQPGIGNRSACRSGRYYISGGYPGLPRAHVAAGFYRDECMIKNVDPSLVELHHTILAEYIISKGLPATEPEFLARGVNNVLYRFDLAGRQVVAKIGTNCFYRQLHIEFEVLRRLYGISPAGIDFFTDKQRYTQVLLLEFAEGRHPFVFQGDMMRNVGAVIARYHQIDEPVAAVPVETCRNFLENRILQVPGMLCRKAHLGMFNRCYRTALDCTERMEPLLNSGRRVLVHGDLIPLNIIADRFGFLKIIDWEGARYDAPEADLATLVKAFGLNDAQTEELFAAYGLPVDRTVFLFRLAVHYLQVIAWRLAVQIPGGPDEENEKAAAELAVEFSTVQELFSRLVRTLPAVSGISV